MRAAYQNCHNIFLNIAVGNDVDKAVLTRTWWEEEEKADVVVMDDHDDGHHAILVTLRGSR